MRERKPDVRELAGEAERDSSRNPWFSRRSASASDRILTVENAPPDAEQEPVTDTFDGEGVWAYTDRLIPCSAV